MGNVEIGLLARCNKQAAWVQAYYVIYFLSVTIVCVASVQDNSDKEPQFEVYRSWLYINYQLDALIIIYS